MERKSPNLEVISNVEASERRRVPRINVVGEMFRVKGEGERPSKVFAISDLSREGMSIRIIDPEDLIHMGVSSVLHGTINLRGEKVDVTARVKRLSPEAVGLRFEEESPALLEALDQFLNPARLGKELRPTPSADLGGPLWYHGPSGTDALFWRKSDGEYSRFTLYIQSSYIQWEAEQGISTGKAEPSLEQSESHGAVRFETKILKPDQRPDPGKLEIANALILSSNLPQELKRWCSRRLTRALDS